MAEILRSRVAKSAVAGPGIAILIAGVTGLVYVAGGTRTVYPHFGYLPVIAAAYFFGRPGGIIGGVLTGLALGPWMPLAVTEHSAQEPINWLWRTGFFVLVGVGVGEIVQRLRKHAKAIYESSHFEPSTHLPNRVAFLEDLSTRIQDVAPDAVVSCVMADLLGYERILCGLGPTEADELASVAANRLEDLAPGVRVYQLRPARFAVLIDGDAEQARQQVHSLTDRLATAVNVRGLTVPLSFRFGIAANSAQNPRRLGQQAATALELAHQQRQDYVLHRPELDQQQQEAAQLIGAFRDALDSGIGLGVVYQPIVDLSTGRCHSVEALLRWRHETFGIVSPAKLIPLVETAGLTPVLTQWLIRHVMDERRCWADHPEVGLAINVSVLDLETSMLPEQLEATLSRADFPAERFEVEVTESEIMLNVGRAMETLHQLRALGVSIAIDDFGTGQSSLAYLSQLPATTLKIDRSFIDGLTSEPRNRTIARAALQLARDLGLKSVAEGVESQEVHDQLVEWGCDRAQGYFYSKPMPAHELVQWLQARA